ncbi:uncharacterized protein LACBIDRAFT_298242 [Laccaria bicolor S238N-H82]|uniref:Predicted protein n=1 Tax=Laccaria bicolor (strain S238N-H82 / ATCC MYA-4686) TaxID=486041 RepID=B0DCJ5_LACBS|nr:uncharacterized protein LACBIDRAFT_298242 [Laccaria bicolor S238N-H82]EDR07740.1 predicted protein [Laccaria bicolor S238N-H82]|eukprot:XP_001881529.1 predicted protein [Laccaria bicolor S238N-H82]
MMKMATHVFRLEDAVKIIEGDKKGLFGRISKIKGNEADVFLPENGLTSTLPLSSLRKNIKVGDAVRVTAGVHQGFIGWVVNKDNDKTGNEVGVSPGIVQFFTPAFHYNATATDSKLPLMAAQKDAMKGDPNSHLIGKHVTVTQGNFKNYRGHIKSMMGDGRVLVELGAQLHRPEPFKISSLHLNMDAGLFPVTSLPLVLMAGPSSDYLPSPNTANPALKNVTPLPIPYPHMLHTAPPEVPATPLPNPGDIPASPAWNPSSCTPRPGNDGGNIQTTT